jgi:hypothetical protein
MDGVRLVRPVPNAADSTAYVYLNHDGLPDLDAWQKQFAHVANGTHLLRGVEITLGGTIQIHGATTLSMVGNAVHPEVWLQPIEGPDKIAWDVASGSPQPLEPQETEAYSTLLKKVRGAGGIFNAVVTGPLKIRGDAFVLEVRKFQ